MEGLCTNKPRFCALYTQVYHYDYATNTYIDLYKKPKNP